MSKEIKRPFYAKFPAIENVVIEFVSFVRAERLSVTFKFRKEAETRNILNFMHPEYGLRIFYLDLRYSTCSGYTLRAM